MNASRLSVRRPTVRWRADWLRSPLHDVVMASLWIPFAGAALVVNDDPEGLRWLVSATLLFSFLHQPLTLWLVYGDAAQRRAHARMVVWAPVAFVLAVPIAASTSPELVALVAGLWNVGHTLRQRYGLCRLYGRLGSIDCGADNRLLWSWLVLAVFVAFAGADLGSVAHTVGLGRRNRALIEAVESAQVAVTVLLPVALVAAILIAARWIRIELQRPTHSASRLVYIGSTAAMLAVLAVNPIAGFVGYVGAHAAEYFLVVRWRVDRAAQRRTAGDAVGWLARRVGGIGTMGLYAVAVSVLTVTIRAMDARTVASVLVLTLGALHLLFDGVIWRSPRSATAIQEN